MSHTLIDIFNNIIKYNNNEIKVIVDDRDNIWFCAKDVARLLEYADTKFAIRNNVAPVNKIFYRTLKKFVNIPFKNEQPASIYINQSGLYELMIDSTKPLAKEFRLWITNEVIPSLTKTGSYTIKNKKDLDKALSELKETKKQVRILEHNQTRTKHKPGGVVYIMRPIDHPNKKFKKMGFTYDLNERLDVANSAIPNNMEVLFRLYTDEPERVEACAKIIAAKFQYRPPKKEYYEISLKMLKKIIYDCNESIRWTDAQARKQQHSQSRIRNKDDLIDYLIDECGVTDDDTLYLKIVETDEQTGGGARARIAQTTVPEELAPEELAQFPINNPAIIDKYCQAKLYPYIDRSGKIFYECTVDDIKKMLSECKEETDIKELNLNLGDKFIVELPEYEPEPIVEQKGGSIWPQPNIPTQEFAKQIMHKTNNNDLLNHPDICETNISRVTNVQKGGDQNARRLSAKEYGDELFATYNGCILSNGSLIYKNGKMNEQKDGSSDHPQPKITPEIFTNQTYNNDLPDVKHKGGAPRLTPEEFGKQIITMNDRMILPNGLIIYRDGKTVHPF